MKKSIIALIVLFLCMSATALPAHAQELKNENSVNEQFSTYDSLSVEWGSIDSISVLYLDGNLEEDPFLKEAKSRGIPIILEKSVFIQPRSSGFEYFKSISWINRSDGITLSVMPKDPFTISKEEAWSEILKFIQYHPMYTEVNNSTKQESMYNQFVCHADFARGFKTPWNLEPWRDDKGYWGFVKGACN